MESEPGREQLLPVQSPRGLNASPLINTPGRHALRDRGPSDRMERNGVVHGSNTKGRPQSSLQTDSVSGKFGLSAAACPAQFLAAEPAAASWAEAWGGGGEADSGSRGRSRVTWGVWRSRGHPLSLLVICGRRSDGRPPWGSLHHGARRRARSRRAPRGIASDENPGQSSHGKGSGHTAQMLGGARPAPPDLS